MEQILETVLQVSLSTAAVIGILLLLVPMWQRWYSARWRKAIWFVVAIRLLLPFSLELPEAPVQMNMDLTASPMFWQSTMSNPSPVDNELANQKIVAESFISETQLRGGNHTTSESTELSGLTVRQALSRGMLWCIVWLLGMLLFLCWHSGQYLRFYWKVLRAAKQFPESEALLQQASQGIKINRYPIVLVSSKVQGPMLVGFVKPTILLPNKLYGERELILILRHELVHYQQKDLWYKLLLVLVNAVHWFNPLVYLMMRQASRDLEQVCDEKVIENQDIEYRKAYSMTILQAMSSSRGIVLSTYLSKQAQNSKKRFTAILQPKQYKKGIVTLIVIVGLAVLASGCLQMGEKDQGLALYQQVKQWLPEDAIQNPQTYMTATVETIDVTDYFWGESPAKTPKDKEERHLWTLYYDNEKLYQYQRMLSIRIDNNSKDIIQFRYWQNNDVLTPPQNFQSSLEELAAGNKYISKFSEYFIKNGKNLNFRTRFDRSRSYTAYDSKNYYQYDVQIEPVYGYITCFSKSYVNHKLEEQALDWLKEEYQQNLGDAYTFSYANPTLEADVQYYKNRQYTIKPLFMRIEWQPKITEKKQKQLEYLRQIDEVQYKAVIDTYSHMYFDYPDAVQIRANVKWNGMLDLADAQLFYYDNEEWKSWQQANWDQKDERLQIMWTAASFANAYGRKHQDAMTMFGGENLLSIPNYDYKVDQANLLSECKILSEILGEQSSVKVQQGIYTDYDGKQYLDLTLEKIDGEWTVTDAILEK